MRRFSEDIVRLLQAAQVLAREFVTVILYEKLPSVHQNGGAYVELLEANCGICHPLQKCLLILHFILHSTLLLLCDVKASLSAMKL